MKLVLNIYIRIVFVTLQRTLRSYVSALAEKLEFLLTRTSLVLASLKQFSFILLIGIVSSASQTYIVRLHINIGKLVPTVGLWIQSQVLNPLKHPYIDFDHNNDFGKCPIDTDFKGIITLEKKLNCVTCITYVIIIHHI